MDELKTTTILSCAACGGEIPMLSRCVKDGLSHYHEGCAPRARTMENKQQAKTISVGKEEE